MSDRNSACIFGFFFELLARNPTKEHKEMALKVWKKAPEFDFSDDDMHCDLALIKLGLACKGVDPEYPEDGATIIYGPVK